MDQFKNRAIQETSADKLILVESILKPAGPVYQVINEFVNVVPVKYFAPHKPVIL
jgi:2'-5' RNA ligase